MVAALSFTGDEAVAWDTRAPSRVQVLDPWIHAIVNIVMKEIDIIFSSLYLNIVVLVHREGKTLDLILCSPVSSSLEFIERVIRICECGGSSNERQVHAADGKRARQHDLFGEHIECGGQPAEPPMIVRREDDSVSGVLS